METLEEEHDIFNENFGSGESDMHEGKQDLSSS